ncbi:DUF6931 family protein [Falsihalocynthiibacter arcticus]|uniref:Uncharacterized protein n=1 Tax=Falsihalocynthiibacter arcticus TaxID=1579316 RepID=A0A126UXA5_9RHOB|nr:hypothetical protein [Falsihalocynthiibacter arcticus]AML50711.1 hypothetical protein RC74_04910 [Falsihalocynthiibacter arcticus]
MTTDYTDLKKVPNQPAVRLLAMANAKLGTKVKAPANASVSTVLQELDGAEAYIDILRLMSVALPPRERCWWACLAARDVAGPDVESLPAPLLAAEKWVRSPSDETREAARVAVELADMDDDTVHCAIAVVFSADTLGPGNLAQYPAPAGASQSSAFGMNIIAMGMGEDIAVTAKLLINRALNIARGGNGNVTLNKQKDTQEMPS